VGCSFAQEQFVYEIRAGGCPQPPESRSQTGFRVRGTKGIFSALHGVLGCRRIFANTDRGEKLSEPLVIVKVDIDRDTALLLSAELNNKPGTGIEVADRTVIQPRSRVMVIGHPNNIYLDRSESLALRQPPLVPLYRRLPRDNADAETFKRRHSPNSLADVLDIEGVLQPGHSGAPVLDTHGRVVGIANGGLKGGLAGINWAIPFHDVQLTLRGNVQGTLEELQKTHIGWLFDIQAAPLEDIESLLRKVDGESEAARALQAGTEHWNRGQKQASIPAFDAEMQIALRFWRRAAELDPRVSLHWVNVGTALNRLGRYAEAVVPLQRGIKMDPGIAWYHNELCMALQRAKRYLEADVPCREAVRLDRSYAQFQDQLSAFFDKAEAHRVGSIADEARKRTESGGIHFNKGVAGIGPQTDTELIAALADFRVAESLEPNSALHRVNVGITLSRLGRYEEAAVKLRMGLNMDPSTTWFQNELCVVLLHLNRHQEAREHCEEAIRKEPARRAHQQQLLRFFTEADAYRGRNRR
jgi:tetratricopeptide (TPR) repeat protein